MEKGLHVWAGKIPLRLGNVFRKRALCYTFGQRKSSAVHWFTDIADVVEDGREIVNYVI